MSRCRPVTVQYVDVALPSTAGAVGLHLASNGVACVSHGPLPSSTPSRSLTTKSPEKRAITAASETSSAGL